MPTSLNLRCSTGEAETGVTGQARYLISPPQAERSRRNSCWPAVRAHWTIENSPLQGNVSREPGPFDGHNVDWPDGGGAEGKGLLGSNPSFNHITLAALVRPRPRGNSPTWALPVREETVRCLRRISGRIGRRYCRAASRPQPADSQCEGGPSKVPRTGAPSPRRAEGYVSSNQGHASISDR